MIRRPPRSTQSRSSAASDVYKRQAHRQGLRGLRRHLRVPAGPRPAGPVGPGLHSRARPCTDARAGAGGLPAGASGPIPDLVERDFTAEAPGTKMVGDITYIPTWEGWLYLATVI